MREDYQIVYYDTVGGHGHTGKNYSSFPTALQDAKRFIKDPEMMDGLEYVGIEPYGGALEFAILYVEPSYVSHLESIDSFATEENQTRFLTACRKWMGTKKPVISSLVKEGEQNELKERIAKTLTHLILESNQKLTRDFE